MANNSGAQWEMHGSDESPAHVAFYDPDHSNFEELFKPVLNSEWLVVGMLVLGTRLVLMGNKNNRSKFAMAMLFFGQSVHMCKPELWALERYWFLVPGQFPVPWVAIVNLLVIVYCLKVICQEVFGKSITRAESFFTFTVLYLNVSLFLDIVFKGRHLYSGEYVSIYGYAIDAQPLLERLVVVAQSPAVEFHVHSACCGFWLVWVKAALKSNSRPDKSPNSYYSWMGIHVLILVIAFEVMYSQIPKELLPGYYAVTVICVLSMLWSKITQ